MKRTFTLAVIVTLMSAPVFAAKGGFFGPGALTQQQIGGMSGLHNSPMTVEKAKGLNDDATVTLRGYITEQRSSDDYTFKDSTGTISVDIDQKHWNGLNVTPNDLVEIEGEVDKDKNSLEIDVKKIRKVSQ